MTQPRGAADVSLKPQASAFVAQSRIRVVVRVRPKLAIEQNDSSSFLTIHRARNALQLATSATALEAKSFVFDQVFEPHTSQREIYDEIGFTSMLTGVLEGYHATVFAYGQTGSGKTFTMEGSEYERVRATGSSSERERVVAKPKTVDATPGSARMGIIPRAIFDLFAMIAARSATPASAATDTAGGSPREFTIKCSFVQIYNEQILDLFNPTHVHSTSSSSSSNSSRAARLAPSKPNSGNNNSGGLKLRWSATREFYVENLRVLECATPEHVLAHFHDGLAHKVMASHRLNAASSRSHCVFTIYVESTSVDGTSDVLTSKLALVDLAGSERVDKTGATGVTLHESIGINKSLFVLRQVIQALSDDSERQRSGAASNDRAYIPYRDSKLTSLLKYSLGGNSLTLLIACLSPSDTHVDENLSTLVYAAKAQRIANAPTKNEDPKSVLIHELRRDVETLRAQLAQAQDVILSFESAGLPSANQVGLSIECAKCRADARGPENSSDRGPAGDDDDAERPESMSVAGLDGVTQASATRGGGLVSVPVVVSASVVPTPPARLAAKPTVSTPVDTTAATTTTKRLKLHVIDNVAMIKQLYATEKALTDRVCAQSSRIDDLTYDTRVLTVENQSLRDKIEVLEYLIADLPRQLDDDPAAVCEQHEAIPEYGTLTTVSSLPRVSASAATPPVHRIREVLDKSRASKTRTAAVRLHDDAAARTGATSNQSNNERRSSELLPPTKTKRIDLDTGLLSLNELKELLRSKKPRSEPSTLAQSSSNSSRRGRTVTTMSVASDPRAAQMVTPPLIRQSASSTGLPDARTAAPSANDRSSVRASSAAAALLSTLEQNPRMSVLELDPLDSLSELNRLLQVKATLRRTAPSTAAPPHPTTSSSTSKGSSSTHRVDR